ncbi:response regulator transcription factor [Methylophaga thalassica]|uniref:response regulator transcription factor n=1 Tax=Methylophaga thalassica TaxID=40223 RepID=UPI002E7BFD85|nr:response regulator transcription factor [Methylophaga thalassica]WVI85374.1 response regulator transcription factor [Methylophaga thalassica]
MNILIADDHPAIRSGLEAMLKDMNWQVSACVSSGELAYEHYCQQKADVVVLDLSMPGIGGIETARRIKARDTDARIIIYSMHSAVMYAKQALMAGALSFVLKSTAIDDLFHAIKQVAQGRSYLSHEVAQKMAMSNVMGDSPIDKLSTREFEVLCLLANGKGVGDIAEILSISKKTVATYQTQLKRKLELNSTADLVKLAIEHELID